jgi:hypothetical protein
MKKFEIVETPDYVLAVSDEKPTYPEHYYFSNSLGDRVENAETKPSGIVKKIIGYQPKGNAPELDLPLLPEVAVDLSEPYSEEDMRKAFNRGVGVGIYLSDYKTREMWEEFLKSLKKSKSPKFFIAETGTLPYLRLPEGDSEMILDDSLLTETNSEGKQVLKGHYL